MPHQLVEQVIIFITLTIALAVTLLAMHAPVWMETAWAYDAANDVLPDWLWDAGIPGNPKVR